MFDDDDDDIHIQCHAFHSSPITGSAHFEKRYENLVPVLESRWILTVEVRRRARPGMQNEGAVFPLHYGTWTKFY